MSSSVGMNGTELLQWLVTLPPEERDRALEARLGIADGGDYAAGPGPGLIGYHASGVASIVRMVLDVPIVEGDVVIDLGAGLGKAVLLTRLLSGATVRGVEIQAPLVERARHAAARLNVDVAFSCGDARSVPLDDGTVFFLYLPFTGEALVEVLARLRAVASHRSIVVCALGVDLEREAPWLRRRASDSFWLAIYDSVVPGAAPQSIRARSPVLGSAAPTIADGRGRE